jgi:hypothetical protein
MMRLVQIQKRWVTCLALTLCLCGRTAIASNLLVNGGAESGTKIGTSGGFDVFSTPGWTVVAGAFTAESYAQGVFPNYTTTSPGPSDRGNLLFVGGVAPVSTAIQTVDVSAYAALIDSSSELATISGWLGGFLNQDDNVTVTTKF